VLREQGRKGRRRRAVVDQAAAVVILQNALDTERGTGAAPGELIEPDPGRTDRSAHADGGT
jgi:putative Holliday junction resolvase